ncbi:MAG: hypothetical protein AAF479_09365 [Pseudomonadota bacterium]
MPEPQQISVPAFAGPGKRLTGRNASVWKYDLLTALSIYALGQGAGLQTTVLRLLAAVTARYDWRRDELSIGRIELTRLWQCSEPTVKREMRRLRDLGLLIQIRPGLRGRVAAYRLCRRTVEQLTGTYWDCAGADFSERMRGATSGESNVVGFPQPDPTPDATPELPEWVRLVTRGDMVVYRNWFSDVALRRESDTAVFRAPSAFIASQLETRFSREMQEAIRFTWPDVQHIRIVVM